MKISSRRACVACVVACCAASAAAADQGAITLRQALDLASAYNPSLRAFESQSEAAKEDAALQALAPSPVVELELENFAGTGALSGSRALESTLRFSREVELGGRADARRRLGDVQIDRLSAQQMAQQADTLAEVARRFVKVLADQERLRAIERSVALAEESNKAVRSRVEVGAASPVQASRAEIALARAGIELEHAGHELLSSRVALAVQWGEIDPRFDEARGELFHLESPAAFEQYARRLENNPTLLALASARRVLDARTGLARAQRQPNVTFSVGVRHLNLIDDAALVAGVAVPFGSATRADSERRAVTAEAAAQDLNRQSHRLELHATLFGVYQELLHARTEALALRDHIRPQAQQMLVTAQAGYRAGRFSFLELADAQRQLLEIDLDAIQAAERFHLEMIEIERLTGESVFALVQGETP